MNAIEFVIKQNTVDFVKKANKVHSNKYSYDKTQYVHSQIKIIIVCPIHGDFEQLPANHLHGRGCQKCGKVEAKTPKDPIKFILECQEIHPALDYSETNYIGVKVQITVNCLIHGAFKIHPTYHLNGNGCKECKKLKKRLLKLEKCNER